MLKPKIIYKRDTVIGCNNMHTHTHIYIYIQKFNLQNTNERIIKYVLKCNIYVMKMLCKLAKRMETFIKFRWKIFLLLVTTYIEHMNMLVCNCCVYAKVKSSRLKISHKNIYRITQYIFKHIQISTYTPRLPHTHTHIHT